MIKDRILFDEDLFVSFSLQFIVCVFNTSCEILSVSCKASVKIYQTSDEFCLMAKPSSSPKDVIGNIG